MHVGFVERIDQDFHRCVVHLGAVMVLYLLVLIEEAEVPGSFTETLASLTNSTIRQANKLDTVHGCYGGKRLFHRSPPH